MTPIYSIGHSTLSYEKFVSTLKEVGVSAIADVRTSPFSRTFPHFSRDAIKRALARDHISYVFLGVQLGIRPKNPVFYSDGIADYEKMATTESFKRGLDRVEQGAGRYCVALMCSEHNPLDCHRCLLVSRALSERGSAVEHIVDTKRLIGHEEIESCLLELADRSHADMFASPEE